MYKVINLFLICWEVVEINFKNNGTILLLWEYLTLKFKIYVIRIVMDLENFMIILERN